MIHQQKKFTKLSEFNENKELLMIYLDFHRNAFEEIEKVIVDLKDSKIEINLKGLNIKCLKLLNVK